MNKENLASIRAAALALVHQAELAGVVLTIATVPGVPLAMRNYRMEVRWSDNQVDRLPALARELLAKRPDVAVGAPVLSAQALHHH